MLAVKSSTVLVLTTNACTRHINREAISLKCILSVVIPKLFYFLAYFSSAVNDFTRNTFKHVRSNLIYIIFILQPAASRVYDRRDKRTAEEKREEKRKKEERSNNRRFADGETRSRRSKIARRAK